MPFLQPFCFSVRPLLDDQRQGKARKILIRACGVTLGGQIKHIVVCKMPEIIRGAGESCEFDHLVDSLQSLYHDPERLKTYREGAFRRTQDFSPEVCRKLLFQNYQECLNEKNTEGIVK